MEQKGVFSSGESRSWKGRVPCAQRPHPSALSPGRAGAQDLGNEEAPGVSYFFPLLCPLLLQLEVREVPRCCPRERLETSGHRKPDSCT